MHVTGLPGALFDELKDLGRRGARVAIDPTQTSVNRAKANRLVAKENFSVHVCPVSRPARATNALCNLLAGNKLILYLTPNSTR